MHFVDGKRSEKLLLFVDGISLEDRLTVATTAWPQFNVSFIKDNFYQGHGWP